MSFSQCFCGVFEHFADGEVVGATCLAYAAVDTVGGDLRKSRVSFGCPILQAIAAIVALEEKHRGDVDSCRAGSAIVATAAEVSTEIIADRIDPLLLVRGERRRVGDGGDVRGYLLGSSHTGNYNRDVGVAHDEAHSHLGILDSTAGERLHANESNITLGADGDQLLALRFV